VRKEKDQQRRRKEGQVGGRKDEETRKHGSHALGKVKREDEDQF
jgi:hypothetical protein